MSWEPLAASSKVRCPTLDCGGVLLILKRIGFCMKCQQGFQKPKPIRKQPKRKIVPSPEWTQKILEAAEANERDFLILALAAEAGLRRAEIVGTDDPRVPDERRLPGLRIEDLRDDGVLIKGKGGKEVFQAVNIELIQRIRKFTGTRKLGNVFDYSTDGVRKLCIKYGKQVGYPDALKLHPHSLRHFYGTFVARKVGRDPFKVRDMMRHSNVSTTNRYVDELQPDEKKEIAGGLAIV